jgi:hypothetical protein
MMLALTTLASLLATTPLVAGHGGGMFYTIDDVKHTGYVQHAAILRSQNNLGLLKVQRASIADLFAVHITKSATTIREVCSVTSLGAASGQSTVLT